MAGVQRGRRCCYFLNHHQTAKAAVPTTAVMEIEISNESAVSLIQSVTAHNIQSAQFAASKCERLTSHVSHGSHLVTRQPLHTASFGAVWSVYPQCCPMSGCCLAALGGLPVGPSLAFIVVSLVLAGHGAGGSSNDGFVNRIYRFRWLEQF